MKGIAVEIRKNKMVIMKEDGTFINAPLIKGIEIGKEVEIKEPSVKFIKFYKYGAMAASIMLFFIIGIQVNAYYTPYGYVDIDINPSIRLEYNKFDRILSVSGLNEDGNKVISHTSNIKNSKVEDAVANLVISASNDNYLKEGTDNEIMLSSYSTDTNHANIVKNKVATSVNQYINKQSKKTEVINETISKDDAENAKRNNISVGKYKLYQKARNVDPTITLEDVKNKPVKETVKLLNEKKKEIKSEEKLNTDKNDSTVQKTFNEEQIEKQSNEDTSKNEPIKKDLKNSDKKQDIKESQSNNSKIDNNKDIQNSVLKKDKDLNQIKKPIEIPKIQSELDAREKIKKINERIKNIKNLN